MSKRAVSVEEVTITFAGDSGDGMQLTGNQFTNTTAIVGNDLSTFPDFPAEIRAPAGTLAGVSGFRIHFGSKEINSPGDYCDVLIVMNAAALKVNLRLLKTGGTIIANTDGFLPQNLDLAKYKKNPLEDGSLDKYHVFPVDLTKLTRACLENSGLSTRDIDRSKNMFSLGLLYWMYNRPIENTIEWIRTNFAKKPHLVEANINVLKAGWNYGETTETFSTRYEVSPAQIPPGKYRNIMGNQALAMGLVAASKKSGLSLFLGSYPITPASDILHELSKYKNFGVRTFQAEDEIAAICSAIGASFGGSLAVTTTSGPGVALKTEAIGLAIMLELPLVICNIQRGGPSTGLPTKTEQADLLQAIYGRNGEAPLVVLAARTPADCFDAAFEACRISVEHMIPVMLLSDGYLANGAEPWLIPEISGYAPIKPPFIREPNRDGKYLPYLRDEKLSRSWALPGTPDLQHRIGGLEKEHETGNISYDSENHEFMTKLRAEKVEKVSSLLPPAVLDQGKEKGDLLVVGWGSTYGAIRTAVKECILEGYSVSHLHLRYLNPFQQNVGEILYNFGRVIVPEINNGQLVRVLRDKFLVPATGLNKIQGIPFTATELIEAIKGIIDNKPYGRRIEKGSSVPEEDLREL